MKRVEHRFVERAVGVGDDLHRQGIDAWRTGQIRRGPTSATRDRIAAASLREISDQLLPHDVEIVQQPFRPGRDLFPIADRGDDLHRKPPRAIRGSIRIVPKAWLLRDATARPHEWPPATRAWLSRCSKLNGASWSGAVESSRKLRNGFRRIGGAGFAVRRSVAMQVSRGSAVFFGGIGDAISPISSFRPSTGSQTLPAESLPAYAALVPNNGEVAGQY